MGNGVDSQGQLSGFLKFGEITLESETQLILGLYILLVLGPAEGLVDKIIQFLGVAASFLSVVKGIGEFHIFTSHNGFKAKENQKPVNLFHLLKSSTFFLPHTLF